MVSNDCRIREDFSRNCRYMKFITVASKDHPGLTNLKKSANHFGIDLEVLGYGQPYHGNGTKIHHLVQYLSSVDPEDIVLFTDAYDSIFVRDPSDLTVVFKEFEKPVVFSCEDNYYFRIQAIQNLILNPYYKWKYPKSESKFRKYRYLNSGGYIGYAGKLLQVFTESSVNKMMRSDQVNLHRYFVDRPGKIHLDYDHEIFTNFGKFAQAERFTVESNVLTNNVTGSKPYVFHFPGPTHRGMNEFIPQFSFMVQ